MGKLNLSGSMLTIDLDLSLEYFYLYITNNGTHDLSPLYVNYGSTDQTVDYILMKADGKKYRVGYYRNNPGVKIRAYWSDDPSSFTQWEKGVDFSTLFEENQEVHLTNNE